MLEYQISLGQTEAELSLIQLLKPPYQHDPYPLYDRLRVEHPIHWDEALDCWVLTRYRDVVAVLRDQRFSAQRSLLEFAGIPADMQEQTAQATHENTARVMRRQMLLLDSSQHTRLRRLLNKPFTPYALEALRPFMQQQIDATLDSLSRQNEIDILNDFAYPLLVSTLAHLLGLPPEACEAMFQLDQAFGTAFEGGLCSQEQIRSVWMQIVHLLDYFQQFLTARQNCPFSPSNDLTQKLIEARRRGEIRDDEELLANYCLVLEAGFGSTVNQLGHGLLALFQHPAQLEEWCRNPTLTSSAVEEILRYDPVLQAVGRIASTDLIVGNTRIRAGQRLMLCLGAANRDPAQFLDPNQLDLGRSENGHLAFAYGIHRCLGISLARIQLALMFQTLLQRFPDLHLAAPPQYMPSVAFRVLLELKIRLR